MKIAIVKKYAVCLACSLMAVWPVLHAETVTYTITSRTAVTASGDVPDGARAAYNQTATSGRTGQMTADNSLSLTLSGFPASTLSGISLSMHSNKSAGAGSMTVRVGEREVLAVADASFCDKAWYGAFSSDFVTLTFPFAEPVAWADDEELTITLGATENSLYVESFTLAYQPLPAACHIVFFQTGTMEFVFPRAEQEPGGGVVLPELVQTHDGFYCIGWTETEVEAGIVKPACFAAGTRYYPRRNCTLYALYTDADTAASRLVQDTCPVSGRYLLIDPFYGVMAASSVSGGRIAAEPVTLQMRADSVYTMPYEGKINQEAVFELQFGEDSTLTVRHSASASYVGFPLNSGLSLTKQPSAWNYRILHNKQLAIYHRYPTNLRELRADRSVSGGEVGKVAFMCTLATSSRHANVLFRVDSLPEWHEPHYTSFPLPVSPAVSIEGHPLPVENGVIGNPQHSLLQVFTPTGRLLAATREPLPLAYLPRGMYIIRLNGQAYKLFRP